MAEFVEFLNVLGDYRYACDDHHCLEPTLDGDFFGAGQITYIDNGFEAAPGQLNHPVSAQSWYGSQAYCRWKGGRLPTSAEWEKAARGTDGRKYPWGNEWKPGQAVHAPEGKSYNPAYSYAEPVGSHPGDVSPYGVYDMLGNAREWVLDWIDPDYLSYGPYANPMGPERDEFDGSRTVRGLEAESTQKEGVIMTRATSSGPGIGFRCIYSSKDEQGI